MTKTIFFGSSSYSIIILQQLLKLKDFAVTAVVTKPDKPVGRQQIITANPVAEFAHQHHLPLFQPDLFSPDFKSKISHLSLDIGLCVAYGPPFFDREMIDLFKFNIVNIHPSPLPKYRGATPGPWQIINGETKSAVTFFRIDDLPDHGPIIAQVPFNISPSDTSQTFYDQAFTLAASNLEAILKAYIANPDSLTPQTHSAASYYPKFDKNSAQINWSWDQQKINRFIRALNPWPIAWTHVKDQKGNFLKMKIFSFNSAPVEVQVEGKKITHWSEISHYYSIVN